MTGRQTVFAFVREGPSDDGLLPHLRELLVRAGLEEVIGSARDYKGPVVERLRRVVAEESRVDIIFVHRDADGPDAGARHIEALDAGQARAVLAAPAIPVVPIQELEAWLLLDEAEIQGWSAGQREGAVGLAQDESGRVHIIPERIACSGAPQSIRDNRTAA